MLVTDARLRHVVVDNVDYRTLAWCECKSGRCVLSCPSACTDTDAGARG